jgi:hypothetical protein
LVVLPWFLLFLFIGIEQQPVSDLCAHRLFRYLRLTVSNFGQPATHASRSVLRNTVRLGDGRMNVGPVRCTHWRFRYGSETLVYSAASLGLKYISM